MTDLTYRRIELEDGNGQPLSFEGTELGFASSQHPGRQKDRWQELRIYRTRGGKYVLENIGQTAIEGEAVKSRGKVIDDAKSLIDALHNTDDGGVRYLTYTARDALFEAMERDEPLRTAWAARVQEVA